MNDYVGTSQLSELLNFVEYLTDSDFRNAIGVVKNSVLTIASTKILPIALAIAIIRMVWKKYQSDGKPGIDRNELVTLVVVLIMIPLSAITMSTISRIVDGVAVSYQTQRTSSLTSFYKYSVVNSVTNAENLSEEESRDLYSRLTGRSSQDKHIVGKFLKERYQSDDSAIGLAFSLVSEGVDFKNEFSKAAAQVGSNFIIYFMGLAKLLVGFLIFAFSSILEVFAPLAFTMELIFPGKVMKYLASYLTTKFAFLTFLIIEAITIAFFSLAEAKIASYDAGFSGTFHYLVIGVYIVSIVCYLLVFWFTSKFVGSAETGRFLSAASTVALSSANKVVTSFFPKGRGESK